MQITVSLGNTQLNISENGYERLKTLRQKLLNSVPETMRKVVEDDADARLAEYFTTKVATGNVITETDVEAAFAHLGLGTSSRKHDAEASDADFESGPEDANAQGPENADANSNTSQPDAAQSNGKSDPLSRDLSDVFISGVCSGIARKMDCDVVWIRLAFVCGTLFLAQVWVPVAYLILWAVLPTSRAAEADGPDIRFDSDGGAQRNGCLRGCMIAAICIIAFIAVCALFVVPFVMFGVMM